MAEAKNTLVVVESPAKAKTIGKYLGKGYTVKATVGHIRDLPERELGVDVAAKYKPKFVTVKGKQKAITELKAAAKEADEILIATDPDREGEAIAWHVKDQVGKSNDNIKRVLFHEITKDAIKAAILRPIKIDGRKVEAQLTRRILDRLVGFKVSPLLWKAIKTGLSAGRVQTVALRLIVEREDAIRKFVAQEYWSIAAQLDKNGHAFEAELKKIDGHTVDKEIRNEAAANTIVEAVRGKPFIVTEVMRREKRKRPPAPFTTSTLQQEAAKRLGYSSKRTMQIAQGLYEGVELGDEGAVGLITYMRTDSMRVAASALQGAREWIGRNFEKPYLPETPNLYGGNAQAQDAHEAVRPTDVERAPDVIKRYLKPDQLKLYTLIWQRFVASQMTPIVYDTTTVDFDLGEYLFRATGSVIKFDGYHRLYTEARESEEGRTLDDLPPLPVLVKGDQVTLKAVVPAQHFTEPPPRFSEAALVKELEKLGIGRPSTYAAISSTLLARHYVSMVEKRFHPTELGETVNKLLVPRFPDIFNVEFTSEMENDLDRIEEGELTRVQVLDGFWAPFEKRLLAVKPEEMIGEAHDLSKIKEMRCPTCGSEVAVKTGRFGPYIKCTQVNDPECKWTQSLRKKRAPDRPTDEKCEKCGRDMVIKTGRYGEFMACTGYPKCKNTRPVPLGVKCPKCLVGDLAEKRSRKGRTFYGCNKYPMCDFTTWNKPVQDVCPHCGNPGAEQKTTKARGSWNICLKCGQEFMPPETEPAAAAAGASAEVGAESAD